MPLKTGESVCSKFFKDTFLSDHNFCLEVGPKHQIYVGESYKWSLR